MPPLQMARKLKSISLKRKIEILQEVENSGKKKMTIAKEFDIPKSTLSGIIQNKDRYRKMFYGGQVDCHRKKNRKAACHVVDTALLKWFTKARSANVPVNGPILTAKAEELALLEGRTGWKCSPGWLDRFKKRHNVTYKALCGEMHSVNQVNETTTESWTEEVLKEAMKADMKHQTPSPMACAVLSPVFRRTRKPNYTHEETMALLEQIEANRHILFGKSTNHQRAQLWTFIADAVNSVPSSAGRTVEELKHRWKDMSRRVRMYTRGMTSDNIKNEQASFAPSVYFDIIMRIMGEDTLDGSDFGVLSSTDSQNSASRFAEDSHIYSMKADVDVKPDINVINNFLTNDVRSHNLNNQFVQKSSNISSQNTENTQNSVSQHAAATSANYLGMGIQVAGSSLHRFSSHNVLATDISVPATTGHNSCASTSVGSYTPWSMQISPAAARPMRFDPVTQEVTAIDDYDPGSDTTDGESSSSKLIISAGEKQSENAGTISGQKTKNTTSVQLHGQPPRKKSRVNSTDYSMQALSVEELQKMYLIKKIQLVKQKTLCFKLLENKLKHEINLQQQTQLEPNAKSDSRRGSKTLQKKTLIYQGSNDVDFDEENEAFGPEQRNCDSDNCEQSDVIDGVSDDNEEVINDDKMNDNQQFSA